MITANADYKNSAQAPVQTPRVVVTQVVESDPFVYASDDELMSVKIDTVGLFLGTGTKKATIKLLGLHNEFREQDVTIELGLLNESDTYDYITLGNFTTDNLALDYEANSTTVTLYDAMWTASNSKYSSLDIPEFPMTVHSLAEATANSLNVELMDGFEDLPNADYMIQENLYELIDGTTARDVIAEIAQATATTAIISGTTLKFVAFADSGEAMTSDNLKKLKIGSHYGVINSVVLARVPQEDNITLSDESSIETNGLTEFKIANNEILDDEREELIEPIFDALNGIEFDGINAETEGHGWYEIGDVLTVSQTVDEVTTDYTPYITEIHLTLEGSIKETIVCTVPDPTKTNYATAGGILKTIYNTEIKTDKQNQQIISVVEQMTQLGDDVAENYSQVIQTLEQITNTFQTTGGNNLIKNSVGYATENDDGSPTFWDVTGTGTVTANTSPESLNYGAVSGNQINLAGDSPKMTQRVLVQAGGKYSIAFKVKKEATGSAVLRLTNETDNFEIVIEDSTAYLWNEMSLVALEPTLGYLDVEIESDGAIGLAITDLMMTIGDSTTVWQQASGEILNTQVALNSEGIKVKSSVYEGDFTQITPLEFAGYSSISGTQERVFGLNRDLTFTKKLEAQDQITMNPIKIVPILSGDNAGWAFVAVSGED